MADAEHPTVQAILAEFDRDPEALAAEVLALRRVVEELGSLLSDEPRGPFVIVSPPREPKEPEPTEPWTMPPRMARP
jgi:hypothetical protein